ncbi:MAG: diphosphomevalonate decarboxylase [Methanomassiliicoccales archaeon]
MSKATAIAHPMQGLIKYHGLRDEKLRIPFHDSISVATAPLSTVTTVEEADVGADTAIIDGKTVTGRAMERISDVLNEVRKRAGYDGGFKVISKNDFPSGIGLGASASGFAALAEAATACLGLKLSKKEISSIARLGAGSASRSVTGGFSRWRMGTGNSDSYAEKIAGEEVGMHIIIAIVEAEKQTEDAHREVVHSPLFQGRLAYLHGALAEMEKAIREREVENIGMLAERDTLSLHAITMTGPSMLIFWRPETLSVIREVRQMRKEGIGCYFSIDTGASVYINCRQESIREIETRIQNLGIRTIRCTIGGESRTINSHLF